jgi:hypothetical protein
MIYRLLGVADEEIVGFGLARMRFVVAQDQEIILALRRTFIRQSRFFSMMGVWNRRFSTLRSSSTITECGNHTGFVLGSNAEALNWGKTVEYWLSPTEINADGKTKVKPSGTPDFFRPETLFYKGKWSALADDFRTLLVNERQSVIPSRPSR